MVVAGSLAMIPYFLIERARGSFAATIYWDVVVALILGYALWVAVTQTRHRLGWSTIVVGQLCFLVGDATWAVLERMGHDAYPNLGDGFYIAGYVVLGFGFWWLWRAQRTLGNLAALVDGLIVAVTAGVLLWVFFIGPAVLDGSGGLAARIVNTAYPSGDLLLIAMGAQVTMRLERSILSWMLTLSLLSLLAADIWYAYLATEDTYYSGHAVDALWWISYVLIAALVLHRRVDELAEPLTTQTLPRLSLMRVGLLAATTMAAPVTVALRSSVGLDPELTPLLGGTIVLFLLVVARLAIVAEQLETSRGRLEYDATHDHLTALANRALFHDRLHTALASNTPTSVLCIDLDDFKTVNDSLGHAAGDRLLREIGERLAHAVRQADAVARLGGDEFAVLLVGQPAESAVSVAERLLSEIRRPVQLDSVLVAHSSASIGIAYSEPDDTVESLMRDADVAMYDAKGGGKGRYVEYRDGMRQHAIDRFELSADLAAAVDNQELFLNYQPIIEIDSGAVTVVEALVRWQHPTRGRIEPGRFIGLAEETGLIVPIGRWILREACIQAQFLDARPDGPRIAVNISAVQLRSSTLVADVEDALQASGLAPGRLLLELTESAVIDDYAIAAGRLNELRAMGVRIALDDFGSGYTSLRQLQRFPIDMIKLDPSFVRTELADDAGVLDGLVSMAHALGLETVGEGIEDEAQLQRLRAANCGMAQGFLFARPVPIDDLAAAMDDSAEVVQGLGIVDEYQTA
jgi:diguanylate cyclase (GGDEF)-like protein